MAIWREATQTGIQSVFAKKRLPIPSGELATQIRMEHDTVLWFALQYSTPQERQDHGRRSDH